MANTRDVLGDQETLDGLVDNTLTGLEEDGITNIKHPLYARTALTDVKFPSLTSISAGTFEGCTGITDVAQGDFPNVATINSTAFKDCTGLTEATFPAVTTVASNAFQNCSNLTKVETGTAKTAFTTPFAGCGKLESLIVNSTEMSTLNSATGLAGTAIAGYNGAVYVPNDLVYAYRADNNWRKYFIYSLNDYPVSNYNVANYDFLGGTIEDSWTDIIANQSDYSTKYNIGDTKMLYIGQYGPQLMELVAFDSDERSDENESINNAKARMTFISKNSVFSYEESVSPQIAWSGTNLRKYLINSVLPQIPIKDSIVSVKKVSHTYSNTDETTDDSIWVPSIREIFGNVGESSGVIYSQKFNSANNRKKVGGGNSNLWGTRSCTSSVYYYYYINSSGSYTTGLWRTNTCGIVIGFCI